MGQWVGALWMVAGLWVAQPEADAPTPAPEETTWEESEEEAVDRLRALEAATLDAPAPVATDTYSTLVQLGQVDAVRLGLSFFLDSPLWSEVKEGPPLGRVEDVAQFDVSLVKGRYDIPIEMQPLVEQYVRFFQGAGRKWFRKWMSRSTRFMPVMKAILEEQGLPEDSVYLAMIESGFSTRARSWAAAVGPWQFIPATGKRFGLKQDFWVDERQDPIKSTRAAAGYLKELHGDFGHWYLAWAGYNAGGGKVSRLMRSRNSKDFWSLSEGRGFAKETKHYVPKLIACALVAKHPEAFGFQPEEFDYEPVFEFDEYPMNSTVDLEVVSQSAGVDVEVIRDLNPELKRWSTPPATEDKPYLLRLPKGSKEAFAARFEALGPQERMAYVSYRVKRGDTLSAIAAKYRSAAEAIMRLNGIVSSRSLKVNSELMIPVPKSAQALARQVARAKQAGVVAARPEDEEPAGKKTPPQAKVAGVFSIAEENGKKKVTYGVVAGDTLWSISNRFDCSLSDLRQWNSHLGQGRRGLRIGTALTLYPGPKANLTVLEAKP